MNKPKFKLSVPAALLLGCAIGVLLMIFLPNPLDSQIGNTDQNLSTSVQGESTNASKYTHLAVMAEAEGRPSLSALFYAAAQAESGHASLMLQALPQAESTRDTLTGIISGETSESKESYPNFTAIAEQEGNIAAVRAFTYAGQAEATHAQRFQEALDNYDRNLPVTYHLCPTCGAIYGDEVPSTCPICGTSAALFITFQ